MKRVAFFIVCIFCLSACNNEVMEGPKIPTDEMNPRIELIMPDAEIVNLYSTATFNENFIDSVWVIAFNSSGQKQWVELIPDSLITRNGYASQLLPQLAHEPQNGMTIVCIANVNATSVDTAGGAWPISDINTRFKLDEQGFYEGKHLPMYGDFTWQLSSGYTCKMMRAVAKVQVQMGTSVSDVTGNFSAENVTYKIHGGLGQGTIQTPPPGVVGSGVYRFTNTPVRYLLQDTVHATELNTNSYIYEFPSSNHYANGTGIGGTDAPVLIGGTKPDTTFHVDRQHIILEKDNSPQATTYYRLDFYNPVTKQFLDTKRNFHYLFTINKVRSEGYLSLQQAQNNPGSNIEYDIFIEDGANRITSNGQYGIVTTGEMDTVVFKGIADGGNYTIVSARMQLPSQMASLDATTRNNITVEAITGTDPTAFYDLAPLALPNPVVPLTNTPITVKIKTGTPNGTKGVLTFHLGNITHRVYFQYQQ